MQYDNQKPSDPTEAFLPTLQEKIRDVEIRGVLQRREEYTNRYDAQGQLQESILTICDERGPLSERISKSFTYNERGGRKRTVISFFNAEEQKPRQVRQIDFTYDDDRLTHETERYVEPPQLSNLNTMDETWHIRRGEKMPELLERADRVTIFVENDKGRILEKITGDASNFLYGGIIRHEIYTYDMRGRQHTWEVRMDTIKDGVIVGGRIVNEVTHAYGPDLPEEEGEGYRAEVRSLGDNPSSWIVRYLKDGTMKSLYNNSREEFQYYEYAADGREVRWVQYQGQEGKTWTVVTRTYDDHGEPLRVEKKMLSDAV